MIYNAMNPRRNIHHASMSGQDVHCEDSFIFSDKS